MNEKTSALQQDKPLEIISRIGRPVEREWKSKPRGYSLRKPGGPQFGFVRFNISRQHVGKYTVYAYRPFSDPKQLLVDTKAGREGRFFVDPSDGDAVRYAISVLESAWDGRN